MMSPETKYHRLRTIIFICLALTAATLGVYLQTKGHQFLTYDDDQYVTRNPHVATGLTGGNILWAFASTYASNWHPVAWLSHMVDVRLYGLDPAGHHLTSVFIHTLSALLLFFLLLRLTDAPWRSTFVAFLFALHPLHVESVAWVAERKDVLSALFCFLSLLFYAWFSARRKTALYLLSLLSFALGLMSKPMIVTLPVIMLLLDYWPLNRLSQGAAALVKEKIPFFTCSLLSGIVTIFAQHTGGATRSLAAIPFALRVENALTAYARYIVKTVWPHGLGLFYPLPSSIPLLQAACALFVLVVITAAAARAGRRRPYILTGWLWFLVTLVPVIGLLQVGEQSMADRYSYIPTIGLFIIVAWGVPDLTEGWRQRRVVLPMAACAVVIAMVFLTWRQLGYWENSISLYRHTIDVTRGNYFMLNNLGTALADAGDTEGAVASYREALALKPDNADVHYNLGNALIDRDVDAAIRAYREAIRIKPAYAQAHDNLASALARKGEIEAAIGEYREAIRLKPDFVDAHYNLGTALFRKDPAAAIAEWRETLRIDPGNATAHNNIGFALAARGETAEAIREYREALRIDPDFSLARNNLQAAFARMGTQDSPAIPNGSGR